MCISMTVREGESRLFGGYDAKLYIWERWFKQIAYKKNSSDGEPCGEVILNAEKLSMRYETGDVIVNALKNVSFQIRRGEFIVVLGPSGSGKSTLLNIVGGMDRPTSGAMWYGNQNVTDKTLDQLALYRRDVVGFVFQFL